MRLFRASSFAVVAIAGAVLSAPLENAVAAPGDWTMSKSASPTTYTAAGQVITYTYTITNVRGSDGTLTSLTDDKATITTCPSGTPVPAAGLTCTGTYTTTAADVTAGSVTNNATATGDSCGDGCGVTATATATITFVAAPSWTLTKAPSPTTYTAAGQTITYSYVLTNTGNVAISTISLTDNKVTGISCPSMSLAIGANVTCSGNYQTTAGDVAAGSVTNVVTAHGTPAAGTLADATATATITLAAQPAWTLTKTANPTTYTAAGQTISYSYLLTNTGNVAITGISLTDNKVGGISCPSTSLGIGANMTCSGTYLTTAQDVTAGSVTNTATARGTPAIGTLANVTAQATIRLVGTSGSITIIKTALGLNGTFSFTSSVASATSFTLTTVGGTASRTFSNLSAGSYSFTEVGLPPEWRLTALSCSGGSGGRATVVNLSNRSATVGLDSGESITCTFTNTFDVTEHRIQTQEVIARFLTHRLSLLIDGPDRPTFLRRVPSSLWGDNGSGSSQPLGFTGSTTAYGDRLNFSTSLAQIMRAQASSEKDEIAGALGYAKMPTKAKPRLVAEPFIDAWVEAHYSSFRARNGGVDNDGQFGIVYLGADRLITSNILVGALVQFDWMKENSNNLASTVDGHGTMGGPYVSLHLARDIFFDSRFAWGISNNNVNPFGYYTDAFSTDRWLAHAKLTGNWHWDDFRITPSVAVDYAQERQRDYTDSLGILIPSQTVSLGRMSFGPEIARRFVAANGVVYEPMASLLGQWDFSKTAVIGLNGLPDDSNRIHARATLGLLARAPNGLSARIAGTYDGIGNSSFQATGIEFWLSIPLN